MKFEVTVSGFQHLDIEADDARDAERKALERVEQITNDWSVESVEVTELD